MRGNQGYFTRIPFHTPDSRKRHYCVLTCIHMHNVLKAGVMNHIERSQTFKTIRPIHIVRNHT